MGETKSYAALKDLYTKLGWAEIFLKEVRESGTPEEVARATQEVAALKSEIAKGQGPSSRSSSSQG